MELNRQHWTYEDGQEFQKYLVSCGRPEKEAWTKRIINTNLKCLAILSPIIKKITAEIAKGNIIEFLNLNLWDYFENTSINGGLISRLKDFNTYEKYLLPYLYKADNWATVDLLVIKILPSNENLFLNLSEKLIKDEKPFVRRAGITILFKYINNKYIDYVLNACNGFYCEDQYYVNMVVAWLIAECFAKQREKTLNFLQSHKLNKFTINTAVQKCRDSFRISPQDKNLLLQFKQK